MTELSPLCEICETLRLQRSDFELPANHPDSRYGEVVITDDLENLQIRKSTCPLCELIWLAIEKNENSTPEIWKATTPETQWQLKWLQNNFEYYAVDDDAYNKFESALFPDLVDVAGSHQDYGIQLVDEVDTAGFLRARLVPHAMDPARMVGWLDRCRFKHGHSCEAGILDSTRSSASLATILAIDVLEQCLVEIPLTTQYAALSYVWGSSNVVKTLKTNFDVYKKPGAFAQVTVPQTIRDTMDIVRSINIQYLWVDSLCIIQDDPMTALSIRNMDLVYGHAYVCVIAASGSHANDGIVGWSTSNSRTAAFPTRMISPNLRLGIISHFDRETRSSPYAQRAWTLQEGALSKRRLVFLNSLVFFTCSKSVWREDVHAEVDDSIESEDGAISIGRPRSEWHLRRIAEFVNAFTQRYLTYPIDVLNAFAGIQNAFAASMCHTKFWYGMPACAFDWAIIWTGTKIRRRKGFPSWSWAGWEGPINVAQDHYGDFDHAWLRSRTWIEWYVVDENGDPVLVWSPLRDATTKTNLEEPEIPTTTARTAGTMAETGFEFSEDGDSSPDNDAGDEVDDSNACPQYGWPATGNPYGHQYHPSIRSMFYFPGRSELAPNAPALEAGTLRLETISLSLMLGSANTSQSSGQAYLPLLDSQHQLCGAVVDDFISGTLGFDAGDKIEILLLSTAAPGTRLPFDALKLDLQSPYDTTPKPESEFQDAEDFLGDRHVWDMFNVIFVVSRIPQPEQMQPGDLSSDCVKERRGVGLIHQNALHHAFGDGARWKTTYLY